MSNELSLDRRSSWRSSNTSDMGLSLTNLRKGDLLFISDFSGFFHCLDVETGELHWTHDLLAAVWGSPVVVGDKVYIGDEDGDVLVMEASKEAKVVTEINMGSSVYCSAVPAKGAIFLANRNELYKIAASD